ncbi:MAG: hypothetical protein ACYDCH_08575 [Gaiellaceae bacterium]
MAPEPSGCEWLRRLEDVAELSARELVEHVLVRLEAATTPNALDARDDEVAL